MKRVLCLVSSMNTGGAETFLMKVYRRMDKSQYQMDFCVNVEEEGFYEKEIREMGGRIFRIPPKSKDIKAFKKLLDYREIGGTPFLGIRKPVIKAHGSSDALAFRNAIRQAMNTPDISQELEEGLQLLSDKETAND